MASARTDEGFPGRMCFDRSDYAKPRSRTNFALNCL